MRVTTGHPDRPALSTAEGSGRIAAVRWKTLLSLAIGVAVLVLPRPLAAQDAQVPWRLSYFPYFTVSPNDGLMGIARAIWFKQAPWGERITLQKSLAVEAGYSTRDAWLARATWDDPTLADGWRLKAHVEAGHEPRFGDPDDPVVRDRALGWVDVTRRLEGPLHFAVRGGLRNEQYAFPDGPREQTDATLRGAVVLDLRDREFEINRGLLLEGGVIVGSAGPKGYRALYTHLRGWYNPLPYLRLTGRFAWRETIARGPLSAEHEFPGWEGDFITVGGPHSQRGLGLGQLGTASTTLSRAGGATLAGAEARFDVLNVGELGAVTLMAFVDGGKISQFDGVFQGIPCATTCPPSDRFDWIWAPGGGVAIRVLRAAVLNVTAARADGRTRWYVSSGWSW